MPYWIRIASRLLLAVLLLDLGASAVLAQDSPKVGKPHGVLVLPSVENGTPISIDSFRGRKVLLIHFSPRNQKSCDALFEWLTATAEYRKNEKLVVLGIIQSQHPDRAALFVQWKKPPITVLHDALNLSGVNRKPAVVAIDEHGFVRSINPKLSKFEAFEKKFLRKKFKEGSMAGRSPQLELPDPKVLKRRAAESRIASIERDYADANFLGGEAAQLDEAMRAYSIVLQNDATDAFAYFRLGVALRKRYESGSGRPDDAAKALECWQNALKLQPKNTIFRLRLAQFDGTAAASYSGWVAKAREEIKARGETPVGLAREPSQDRQGSETGDGKSTDNDEKGR